MVESAAETSPKSVGRAVDLSFLQTIPGAREVTTIPIQPDPIAFTVFEHLGMPLSSRQREVLELSARGFSQTQIGMELGITVDTVKNHKKNARDKLGAYGMSEAVSRAAATGELDLSSVISSDFHTVSMETLTERQRDVFFAITDEDGSPPYKEIAFRLGISIQEVKNLAVKLYKKLGIHSRRQALAMRLRLELPSEAVGS